MEGRASEWAHEANKTQVRLASRPSVLPSPRSKIGGRFDLTHGLTTEVQKSGSRNERKGTKRKMAKLTAHGYELLEPGRYALEIVEAESVNEYGPQLKLRLRVVEGEHEGFEFVDYPNRGAESGGKVGTKSWNVFEAGLNIRLSPDEELDTDDLV